MDNKINIGIVGGSGYTGFELIKILSQHKHSNISFITSRTYKGKSISEVFPSFQQKEYAGRTFTEMPSDKEFADTGIVFLCLPPHSSMEYIKNIKSLDNIRIIDIGSDFRLNDPAEYKEWYGTKHIFPELLDGFTYGLPEINMEKIKNSKNIANPGCYPTSVLLGLAPLLKSKYKIRNINIDSKSGVSGAGKKLEEMYLFGNLDNNFYAYGPSGHRHIGEMEQEIKKLCGYEQKIDFTPHLLPVIRGIFSSIYCKIDHEAVDNIHDDIINIYEEFYKNSRFVKFIGKNIPSIRDTVGTNLCMVGIAYDIRTSTLKIFSSIDNLLKGAAGQAVQNMNIMMGFNEDEGLDLNGI